MEYRFKFDGPGGVKLDWNNITYNGLFVKGGKPFIKATMWAAHAFCATAERLPDETGSGWTFEQNTRLGSHRGKTNLAVAKRGGRTFGRVAREVMLKTSDYKTALDMI